MPGDGVGEVGKEPGMARGGLARGELVGVMDRPLLALFLSGVTDGLLFSGGGGEGGGGGMEVPEASESEKN